MRQGRESWALLLLRPGLSLLALGAGPPGLPGAPPPASACLSEKGLVLGPGYRAKRSKVSCSPWSSWAPTLSLRTGQPKKQNRDLLQAPQMLESKDTKTVSKG